MPNVHIDAIEGESWLEVGENNTISYRLNNDFGDGAWTATRVNAYQAAAQTWADVANINFVRFYSGTADWVENWVDTATMQAETGGNWGGWHNHPDAARNQPGYYNIDRPYMDNSGLQEGGLGLELLIHELGHGLGLAHPHDMGQGTTLFPGVASSTDLGTHNLNETRYTIMSYNDEKSNDTDDHGNVATPMAFDIAAIQAQYGANTSHNSGNNTYYLTDNGDWASIWDTGGNDTIRYNGTNDVEINLNSARLDGGINAGGYLSQITSGAGVTGGYTIAGDYTNVLADVGGESGVIIENAIGGSGDDGLYGNGVTNNLRGNSGNDTLKGFGGNDYIYGGTGADNLLGGDGNDYIYGANGVTGNGDISVNDLYGDDGNDFLRGGDGNDSLCGGDDDDELRGNAGNDLIDGGDGIDEADYQYATSAVNVNLATGTTTGGDGNDTLADIENISGSDYNDTLTGNGSDNTILGRDGDDTIDGGFGNDLINGGAGIDIMEGGAGHDIYYVDNANDTTVEAANEGYDRVYVDGVSTWTLASNMERLTFTDSGNHVGYGNEGSNRMEGNEGNDRFVIDGGGSDIYSGGQGTDTYDARSSDIGVRVYLNNQTLNGGAALGETLASMEIIAGANEAGSVASGAGDIMRAGPGRASFAGYNGDDLLIGANNHDQLNGGHGNDRLIGGSGRDTLIGGEGNDLMTGGNDLDQFRFISSNFGQDTITDFQDNLDKLRFFSAVADDFNDFTITGNGTSTVTVSLDADPTNFITVNGIGGSNLNIDAGDIWFY